MKPALVLSWIALSFAWSAPTLATPCVRIYYDAPAADANGQGRAFAIEVQNLLGHFPEFQQIVEPIENYHAGDLAQCKAAIYIGSYFDNAIPEAFLADFAKNTATRVAWLGYSIWKLGPERLQSSLGLKYLQIAGLDREHPDAQGRPGFFRQIHYKGETFEKYGEISASDPTQFVGAPDLVATEVLPARPAQPARGRATTQVLAEAEHSATHQRFPYAIRREDRFYIADVPLNYLHEADRYLIFADLLFDVLDAKPAHPAKRPAIFRVEDVHSCLPSNQLQPIAQVARELKIPFSVALIPVFVNPFQAASYCPGVARRTLTEDPVFLRDLNELRQAGASFIWHGVTHQYDEQVNAVSGMSGADFEFWDVVHDQPVSWDRPRDVLARLDQGWQSLNAAKIVAPVWEAPHYRASALDYALFGQVFAWTIGRISYFDAELSGWPARPDPSLWYERQSSPEAAAEKRKAALAAGQAKMAHASPVGQFYPYEIYGDVYGQRVLPENLGYVSAYSTTDRDADIRALLGHAKRNRVIRDSWGSFFFHPFWLAQGTRSARDEDVTAPLKRLLTELQALGYEFVDVNRFVSDKKSRLRPPPIVKSRSTARP